MEQQRRLEAKRKEMEEHDRIRQEVRYSDRLLRVNVLMVVEYALTAKRTADVIRTAAASSRRENQ